MNNPILYQKVGKKYKQVQVHNAWEYFMNGTYLVHIDDNCRVMYSRVYPDKIALQSAYKSRAQKIADAITKWLKLHSAKKILTKQQKQAWLAFDKAMGEDGYMVQYKSIQSIIDDVEKVILKE